MRKELFGCHALQPLSCRGAVAINTVPDALRRVVNLRLCMLLRSLVCPALLLPSGLH